MQKLCVMNQNPIQNSAFCILLFGIGHIVHDLPGKMQSHRVSVLDTSQSKLHSTAAMTHDISDSRLISLHFRPSAKKKANQSLRHVFWHNFAWLQ